MKKEYSVSEFAKPNLKVHFPTSKQNCQLALLEDTSPLRWVMTNTSSFCAESNSNPSYDF